MIIAALEPVVRAGQNPGASLSWLLTSLLIICIALAEEKNMKKQDSEGYSRYKASAPFMFPIPGVIARTIWYPVRALIRKNQPETGRDIIVTFAVWAVILVLLSLPFVLLNWPPGIGWSNWPGYRPGAL